MSPLAFIAAFVALVGASGALGAISPADPLSYGRVSCTGVDGNADQSLCPSYAGCARQAGTGLYFCGIEGAACTQNTDCQANDCENNVCVGGSFSSACIAGNTFCNTNLACPDNPDFSIVYCGGINAHCMSNEVCASGYCDLSRNLCQPKPLAICRTDLDCASDQFCSTAQGQTGMVCVPKKAVDASCERDGNCLSDNCIAYVCSAGPMPTGIMSNAGRRRALNFAKRGSLCPANRSACAVSGAKDSFECIDTTSNLEQCGGCASDGGVDCTTIEGVEGAACVDSRCEIWSCIPGYTWNARLEICEV